MSEDTPSTIKYVQETMIEYFQLKLDYYKLTGAEKAAAVISTIVILIVLLVLGFFTYLFLMIALGIWASSYFQSATTGFLSIFLFHLILLIIIWLFRKPLLERPILNSVINSILNDLEKKKKK